MSYGQGMTASALAAQSLSVSLSKYQGAIDRNFLRRYYTAQAEFLEEGWVLSTTMDFRWPKTEGKRPAFYGVTRFMARLIEQVAIHDESLVRALVPLADFGAKRWSVVTPGFVLRFMRGVMRHIFARPRLAANVDLFTPDAARSQAERPSVAAE